MASVGSAVLQIIPSTRGIADGINRGIAPQMTTAGKTAGTSLATGMKSSLASRAKSIYAPLLLAAAAYKAVDFFGDSITAASDLGESVNALSVTYGKNADAVGDLGEKAAESLGLSNLDFNSLAVRFSAFAKTVAGGGGDVVGTLDDLTHRASDFASVMNLEVNEAAELFQSGLAGETEPLRKFGIDLSAAAVQAHAYAAGIAESGDELTETQKTQARYSLLMKETAKTQGDFAATSDELAGSQKKLKAQFADVQAEIGTALLPIAKDLVNFLADEGIPVLQDFGEWFTTDGVPALKDFGGFVGDVASDLKPLLDLAVDIGGAIGDLPGPVKEFGAEALVLAFAISKIRTGIATMGLPAFATNLRNAETRTAALGSAAKTTAGVGGVLLLTDAMNDASGSARDLKSAASGALLGFAVAGPIGGAIGAGIGGLISLGDTSVSTASQLAHQVPEIANFADSLDQVTGAATEATRALALQALQANDSIGPANLLGISTRDLIGATLGQEGATNRVVKATGEWARLARTQGADILPMYEYASGGAADALSVFEQRFGPLSAAFKQQQKDLRADIEDLKTWGQALKGVPKEVVAKLRQVGFEPSIKDVRELARNYDDLTAKDLRLIIEETGADLVLTKQGKILDKSALLSRTRAEPTIDALTDLFYGKTEKVDKTLAGLSTTTARPGVDLDTGDSLTLMDRLRHDLAVLDDTNVTSTVTTTFIRNGETYGGGGRTLPGGATGGIVTRPTVALIGESGPEAVVPLNKTGGSSPLPLGAGLEAKVDELIALIRRGVRVSNADEIAGAGHRSNRADISADHGFRRTVHAMNAGR